MRIWDPLPSLPLGWDVCSAIQEGTWHTNQIEEHVAVLLAVQLIRLRKIPCSAVSILTDSKYGVQGLNDWIPRWRDNGYRTSKKRRVTNVNLFQALDYCISLIQNGGTPVRLSYIPRSENQRACASSGNGCKMSRT